MKTVSVTEFRADFHGLLNAVGRTGEPLVLTKYGKPLAMVVSPQAPQGKKWKLGQFRDSATIVDDLIVPMDEPWEALF
jgi:prevent-host-death family protein